MYREGHDKTCPLFECVTVADLFKPRIWCDCGYEQWRDEMESLLRSAGCKCKQPLLGYRPNVGPRCRLCNVVAKENE